MQCLKRAAAGRAGVRFHAAARSRRTVKPVATIGGSFRPSVDPLVNQPRGPYKPGDVYSIHAPEELQDMLATHKDNLVVLMCKSSHCKPCKAFAKKYSAIAAHCTDTVFLTVTGDENQTLRKMMVEMGVKVTPTFRFYRGGEYLGFCTGTKNKSLLAGLEAHLKPGEKTPAGLVLEDEPAAQ